jgi:hypothetical protein
MTALGTTVPFYGGGQVPNPANVIYPPSVPSANLKVRLGTLAVVNATGTMYGAVSLVGGVTTWAVLGGGTAALATLTGNTGGAISPVGGNINVVGSGNVAIAGSGSTLTASITGQLPVANGGTGINILSGLVFGNGTSPFSSVAYVPLTAWTPNLQINGSSVGITYSPAPSGFYQVIGGTVFFTANISLTSKGIGSGAVTISNMPIAFGGNGARVNISVAEWGEVTFTSTYTTLGASGNATSTVLSFDKSGLTVAIAPLTAAELADSSVLLLSGFYFTN